MQHKDSFNADALKDPTDRDGLIDPAVTLGDHHSFVRLDTFLVALADANADPNGVPDIDIGKVGFLLRLLKLSDQLSRFEAFSLRCGWSSSLRGLVLSACDVCAVLCRCVFLVRCHPSSG